MNNKKFSTLLAMFLMASFGFGVYACDAEDLECEHSERFKSFFEEAESLIYNCCGTAATYCDYDGDDRCEIVFYQTRECPNANIDKMIACCGSYEAIESTGNPMMDEEMQIWPRRDAWHECREQFLTTLQCIPLESFLNKDDEGNG
ncbi:MAG: hypothetical protein IIY06_06830 [Proteobacteria bacterium]|jgi:hypothetical protein|nr:hypothetical protein [Pseudomonadota bacterium]